MSLNETLPLTCDLFAVLSKGVVSSLWSASLGFTARDDCGDNETGLSPENGKLPDWGFGGGDSGGGDEVVVVGGLLLGAASTTMRRGVFASFGRGFVVP